MAKSIQVSIETNNTTGLQIVNPESIQFTGNNGSLSIGDSRVGKLHRSGQQSVNHSVVAHGASPLARTRNVTVTGNA